MTAPDAKNRLLKQHTQTLTPKKPGKPAVTVKVDESARLREIRALVRTNNRSKMNDDMVICQIWVESSFDAKTNNDGAKGLMQLRRPAVQQVLINRQRAVAGHALSDIKSNVAKQQGSIAFESESIFDEATNIQMGTEYLQYQIDRTGSEMEGYIAYRGMRTQYFDVINNCADNLSRDADNVQVLHDANK